MNSAIKVGDLSGPGPFSQDYKTSVLPSLVNRLSDDGLLEQMWEMWTCVRRIQSFVYQQPENRLYFSSIFSLLCKLLSLYIFQKFGKFFLSFIIKNYICDLLIFFHQLWFCKHGFVPELCLHEFFPRYTRVRFTHNSEEHTVPCRGLSTSNGSPRKPMYFSALGRRELKFLKLLEQNQACLPKLITPGSQVNHLLRQGCFLPLMEDH